MKTLKFYFRSETADDRGFFALRNIWHLALLAGMAVALPAQDQPPEDNSLPIATAVRTEETLVLDGLLSEEIWSHAAPVTGFLQKNPLEGAPASEKTEVRILFDSRHIYFGVICYDSNPAGIRATELRRDDSLLNDDIFEVILDTFHDHRNGYLFRVNPLGTRYDATVTNEGRMVSEYWDEEWEASWDEKWEAQAQITEQGWSAEISIPFKSLRFLGGEEIVWGVNFHRGIKWKNEDVFWTAHNRDFRFKEVSQAGHLEGLADIQGFTLRLKPFFTMGGRQVNQDGRNVTENLTDVGIEDAKFMVTPQLALDLTVNPDFAQADVDEAQVNLTRFSRFFPETREFFQEGAGIFQFGTGVRQPWEGPQVLLFYSRRIGLSEDREEVPIWGGLKLSGKQGPLEIGLLNMQTKRSDKASGQNFSVVRMKGNILSRSYVGAVFTRNTGGLSGNSNKAAGVDANFTFFQNLNLRGFLARTGSDHLEGGNWAGQGRMEWNSDRVDFVLERLSVPKEENFNPEIGFVGREEMNWNLVEASYKPRPGFGLVRQFGFAPSLEYVTNQQGLLETQRLGMEWATEFESGDSVDINYHRTFERLVEDFDIRGGGGTIPPGDYSFNEYTVSYQPFRGRKISGFFRFEVGGFFNGRQTVFSVSPQFKPSHNVSFEPGYEWTKTSLPDAAFTTQEVNAVVNYSFSQKWLTRATFLLDSQAQQYALNFRLNYIFRPGDDLFVVYNEARNYGSGGGFQNRALIVKLTYSLDR